MKEIHRRRPSAVFAVTMKRKGVFDCYSPQSKVIPIGMSLTGVIRALRHTDRLIIAGGSQIHDNDSNVSRRIVINSWFAALCLFSRALGKAPILLGHGFEIESRLGRLLLKVVLRNAMRVYLRDEESFELTSRLGYGDKSRRGFDPVALLDFPRGNGIFGRPQIDTIGLSALQVHSIYHQEPQEDLRLSSNLADGLSHILLSHPTLRILALGFGSGHRFADISILDEMAHASGRDGSRIQVLNYSEDIPSFLAQVTECDAFIGMRYHSIMLAYVLQRPLIAIEYHKKCSSLCQQLGYRRQARLSLSEAKCGSIDQRVELMISKPDEFMPTLPREAAIAKAREMFDFIE